MGTRRAQALDPHPAGAGVRLAPVPASPSPARRAWRLLRLALVCAAWLTILTMVLLTWGTRVLPYHTDVIIGRSMEPSIPLWSVTIVEPTPVSAVRRGDVLAFERPGAQGMRVTHRVTKVAEGPDGATLFTTKGDNNASVDPWKVQYAGDEAYRIRAHVPHVGWAIWQMQRPGGRLLLVALPTIALLVQVLAWIWRDEDDDEVGERRGPAAPREEPVAA